MQTKFARYKLSTYLCSRTTNKHKTTIMKRFISYAALALLTAMTAMSLTACGSDDDEDNGGSKYAKELTGKWLVTHSRSKTTDKWMESHSWKNTYTFNADGKVVGYMDEEKNLEGTYTLNGDKISIDISYGNAKTWELKILSMKDGEAELALYKDGSTTPAAYYRLAHYARTAEEARQWLIGLWQLSGNGFKDWDSDYKNVEEYYQEFCEDGKLYSVYKIKNNATGKWTPYRGQYVRIQYIAQLYYEIFSNTSDPSNGFIDTYIPSPDPIHDAYRDLTKTSFIYDGYCYIRPEKEVKYTTIEYPQD